MNNGYTHRFGKNTGGIKQILLTPADNIASATVDPKTGRYRSLTLREPAKLAEYSFAEGAAQYREETGVRNGIPSVVHTLEFHTDRIDRESDSLLRYLNHASYTGLAAVVTTNNHTRLVVGYSEEHRAERPLRLSNVATASGKAHTDAGHEAVSLTCRDTAKARILDGSID